MPKPKRIIYGKIGRAIVLDPKRWGPVGGDHEPWYILERLTRLHPDVEFVLAGRYLTGKDTSHLPPNLVLPELHKVRVRNHYSKERDENGKRIRTYRPWIEPWEPMTETLRPYFEGDGIEVLMWLGQHGGANYPVPRLEERSTLTTPLDAFMLYAAPVTLNINRWREEDPLGREETWLMSDVRNYLKARELKWPNRHPVLSQFDFTQKMRNERFDDPRTPAECGFDAVADKGTWTSTTQYVHAGLEVIRPAYEVAFEWEDRADFGILVNEARAGGPLDRASLFRDWVAPLKPSDVIGKWSKKGMEIAGIEEAEPCHQFEFPERIGRVKSTFTMPTSGSGWPTPKPHEMFQLGTICFFHPRYDTQGHVIPTRAQLDAGAWERSPELRSLADWLRVESADQLTARVKAVSESRETYEALRDAQLEVERRYREADQGFRSIEARLGLI